MYYRQVILREEARREFFLKKELERQKEQDFHRERQLSMLKGIKAQIEEKNQRKERERLEKLQENEAVRKEQEEYEKKKQAIAEELKKEYLKIMKENQKLGDFRKQEEIQDQE